MYFWNVKRLKEEHVAGPLEPKAQLQYLVAYTALYQLSWMVASVPQPSRAGATWGAWILNVTTSLIYMAVNILGVIYCYRNNGGSGGRYFLDRLVSLSWVMSVRLFVWVMLATLLLITVIVAARVPPSPSLFLPLVTAAVIFWWWRLGRHLHDISLAMKGGAAPDAPAKVDVLA